MRCDVEVTFVKEGSEVYDPVTGDYITSEPITVTKWANVSDANGEIVNMRYGTLKQTAKVIRLNEVYKDSFDYILVGEPKFILAMPAKHFRRESVFTVGESQ